MFVKDRCCGNTTNLLKRMKAKQIKEHDELMVQRRRSEGEGGQAKANTPTPSNQGSQSSLIEAFRRGRIHPGI